MLATFETYLTLAHFGHSKLGLATVGAKSKTNPADAHTAFKACAAESTADSGIRCISRIPRAPFQLRSRFT